MSFETVCHIDDITPGTGVCAWVNGKQVALFRPSRDEQVFALDNMCPFGKANVLSRGLIAEHQGELWVASPLKKQRFNLQDGRCLDDASVAVASYAVELRNGEVGVRA